jgi:hypothetical protein
MRRILVGLFALLPFACSGNKKEGPGAEDPYATRSAFCGAWAAAACSAATVQSCGAASSEECVASQQQFCEKLVPTLGYTSANAQPCLDAVSAAYSDAKLDAAERDVVRSLASPCDKLSSGFIGEGEVCDETSDCATIDGFECVIALGETHGVCAKPIEVGGGESCEDTGSVCASGFYCDASSRHCLAAAGEGDACSGDAPCRQEYQCTGAEGAQTCVAKAASGDCTSDDDCASDLCQRAAGASKGTCVQEIILSPLEPICADLS